MNKSSKLRQVLFITLIAFIFNAIVPFFAVYNLPTGNAEANELSSVFGDKILICTDDGFKLVSLTDLKNGRELPKHSSKYECALCYVAHKNDKNFVVSDFAINFVQPYWITYKFLPKSDDLSGQSFDSTADPRAPPLLA